MEFAVDVKNTRRMEEARGGPMVAEGKIEIHTEDATSTRVIMETSKAFE
jgi:hypothetical protein